MKKALGIGAFLLVLQLGWVGAANAAYIPSNDTTINIQTIAPVQLPSGTAQASFQLQQQLNQQFTQATGVSLNYSYIWIDVNGTPVLAIDPPSPMW